MTMIDDFGCAGSSALLPRIFAALPGAVAVFAVIAGLAALGTALNRSRRFEASDIACGWGIVTTVMTIAAVSSTKALPFVTLALFIAMAAALVYAFKRRIFVAPFWLLALFPGLLMLAAINLAGISRWDDFSHWVPNAFYLFHYDSVPSAALPPPHSHWPAYPYALPFLTYMASWLAGAFIVQGGAMINFLLLTAFAAMLAEAPEFSPEPRPLSLNALGKTALALALVTLGNPGFNASFNITSQGDTATTVLIAMLALLLWRLTNRLSQKDHAGAKAFALPTALIGVTLVLIKQSDLALLGLLCIGFLAVAAKNRILKPAFVQVFIILIPAFVMRAIWQHYAAANMAGEEFVMRPISAWRFDLLGPILYSMGKSMLQKNGLALMMLGVTAYGAVSLFRPATPRRNFALMVGVTYAGYLAFLLTTYIGASFMEVEARRATSFYRYCTHTSLLGISMLWMAAPALWAWFKNKTCGSFTALAACGRGLITRPAGVALLAVFLPIALAVHAACIVPQTNAETCAVLSYGRKLAAALPDSSRLAVWEPESEGLFTFMINFELDLQSAQLKKSSYVNWRFYRSMNDLGAKDLPRYIAQLAHEPQVTALLVPQAEHDPVTIAGYDNRQAPLVLERGGKNWKRINLSPTVDLP